MKIFNITFGVKNWEKIQFGRGNAILTFFSVIRIGFAVIIEHAHTHSGSATDVSLTQPPLSRAVIKLYRVLAFFPR